MEAVVVIGGRCDFRIKANRSNQPNKSKLLLYSHYFHFNIPFKYGTDHSKVNISYHFTNYVMLRLVHNGIVTLA